MRRILLLTLAGLATLMVGCASRPINEPITKADRAGGYRATVQAAKRTNQDRKTLFALAFSGGGTRAAAFSYGVLDELYRTEIVVDGQRRRLLDEVDLITGVSGGSFTALAYALYGDRLFSEYEQRFLKRDVQGALTSRTLNPLNWPKIVGGSYGRSELAADYYDEILFQGATFADLMERPAPMVIVTGTDISTGARLAFTQTDFDLLCSDVSKVASFARRGDLVRGAGRALAGHLEQLRRYLRIRVSGVGPGRRRSGQSQAASRACGVAL